MGVVFCPHNCQTKKQQLSDASLTIVRRLILCMTGDKFF